MKRKAFTLVELIVVIAILAILWTIAFISFSGYSKEARDSKRITDTSSLLSKINIENTRWTLLSELITNTDDAYLQVLWKSGSLVKTFWESDFRTLKENEKNFRDPHYKFQNYPLAYAIWGSWKDAYRFIQIATISEKENRNIIKWNYYALTDKDTLSLFYLWWITYTEENPPLVYGVDKENWNLEKFSCTWTLPKNSKHFNISDLTENTKYQNTDENSKCYYNCIENYEWNENKTECREIIILPNNCEATTIDQYSLESKNHSEIQLVSKTWAKLENWTQTLEQSFVCDDWEFKKDWEENIKNICNSWFVWTENQCKADLCKWVIPENSESTATSQSIDNSWTNSDTPWICTFKCKTNYTWNWVACGLTSIWGVEIWVDGSGKKWQAKPITKIYQWAISGVGKMWPSPTWNWTWYTYSNWRTKEDYPAFKACTDLWAWWRLPTINELEWIADRTIPKMTKHPWISATDYWTSSTSSSTSSTAWIVNFNINVIATKREITRTNSIYVVCIHD